MPLFLTARQPPDEPRGRLADVHDDVAVQVDGRKSGDRLKVGAEDVLEGIDARHLQQVLHDGHVELDVGLLEDVSESAERDVRLQMLLQVLLLPDDAAKRLESLASHRRPSDLNHLEEHMQHARISEPRSDA
eukprot:754234-Hanusia_phi.AAC.5